MSKSSVVSQARALMVDDDVKTSPGYLKRLTDDGYLVTVATDPLAALGLVKRASPGIIFVHIGDPGSGSIPFIVALRAGDDTRHIPVAVLTSYYNPRLERMGLTAVAQEQW